MAKGKTSVWPRSNGAPAIGAGSRGAGTSLTAEPGTRKFAGTIASGSGEIWVKVVNEFCVVADARGPRLRGASQSCSEVST